MEHGKFQSGIGEKITMRVVKYWNMLPREVVRSSYLQIFKTRLEESLSKLM